MPRQEYFPISYSSAKMSCGGRGYKLRLLNDEHLLKTFRRLRFKLPIYGDLEDTLRSIAVRCKNGSFFEYIAPIRTPYYNLLQKDQRNAWDDWLEEPDLFRKWEIGAEIGTGLLMAFFHYFLPLETCYLATHRPPQSKTERLRMGRMVEKRRSKFRVWGTQSEMERLELMAKETRAEFEWTIFRKSAIGGKFYRDHVDHALRVMLLSNYLIWEIEKQIISVPGYSNYFHYFLTDRREFSRKIWLPLVLSSLYHDLAYPISDPKLYAVHREELDECYRALRRENINKVKKYLSRISQSFFSQNSESNNRLRKEFDDAFFKKGAYKTRDHGVLAAIDFLLLFEKAMQEDEDLSQPLLIAAQAIALHNTLMNEENIGIIRFDEYPVAFLLILCDELQEWGRPIAKRGKHAPPIMNSMKLGVVLDGEGRIQVEASLDFSNAREGFNPFLQYSSKFESLRRLSIDPLAIHGPFLNIALRIPRFKVKNSMLVNEEAKELYDTGGDVYKRYYFKDLQKSGLTIRTCDCGNIARNTEIETGSKPCLLGDKEEKWTCLLSVKPDHCHKCGEYFR